MNNTAGLLFSKDHEWVRIEGGKAYIGITDFAQHSLGDIVFVELPNIGRELRGGDILGTVESVKAVSEVFSPISGKVVEVSRVLENSPELLNSDPYSNPIAAVEMTDASEAGKLMDESAYRMYCEGEH